MTLDHIDRKLSFVFQFNLLKYTIPSPEHKQVNPELSLQSLCSMEIDEVFSVRGFVSWPPNVVFLLSLCAFLSLI